MLQGVASGFGLVPFLLVAAAMVFGIVQLKSRLSSGVTGLPAALRSLPSNEIEEIERGVGGWFRVAAALEHANWMGAEVPSTRRAAAQEIREHAAAAVQRLVHQPMTLENRAWLAFGLERLADEVERPPGGSIDEIGYAINNRHALRLANELVKNR